MNANSRSDFLSTGQLRRFPTEAEHKRIIDFASLRFTFAISPKENNELRRQLSNSWDSYIEELRNADVDLSNAATIERKTYISLFRHYNKEEVLPSLN